MRHRWPLALCLLPSRIILVQKLRWTVPNCALLIPCLPLASRLVIARLVWRQVMLLAPGRNATCRYPKASLSNFSVGQSPLIQLHPLLMRALLHLIWHQAPPPFRYSSRISKHRYDWTLRYPNSYSRSYPPRSLTVRQPSPSIQTRLPIGIPFPAATVSPGTGGRPEVVLFGSPE